MPAISFHEDRDSFREAVNSTSADTTFPQRLIEKDYFCTLLLNYFRGIQGIVFKGGTCLAKVHANFYRLSEDLDFVIPMPVNSGRKKRQIAIEPVKRSFGKVASELPAFRVSEPLTGANNSTQYISILEYVSVLSSNRETIKVEISLREPLVEPSISQNALTILRDPASSLPIVAPVPIACISRREAYAEKFRAALTRREPAIRDYFDIDYAVRRIDLDIEEPKLIDLVHAKRAVPGNDGIGTAVERLKSLREQLESELKPVVRKRDYDEFDLDRAFRFVTDMEVKTKP